MKAFSYVLRAGRTPRHRGQEKFAASDIAHRALDAREADPGTTLEMPPAACRRESCPFKLLCQEESAHAAVVTTSSLSMIEAG